MIIGFVGPLGAGKSTAVEYLKEKNFQIYKLSDVIREKTGKLELSRIELQNYGDEFREKHGLDILAREVWKKIKSRDEKVVIDGLRNPGEVDFFRKKKNFYLVSVLAKKDARFERLKKRGSTRDPRNKKDFLDNDSRDLKEKENFGQQTKDTMKFADFTIKNNSTVKELHKKIDKILNQIQND